jgi:hypothetical protein
VLQKRLAAALGGVLLLAALASIVVLAGVSPKGDGEDNARRPTTTTTTTSTSSTTTTSSTVPPAPVRKVLIVGDSIMWVASRYVIEDFAEAQVEAVSRAVAGSSLLGGTDIRGQFQQFVDEIQPDAVVALFSGVYLPPVPKTPDGRDIGLATPEFWTAWRAAAVDATAILSSKGARVYLVLLPHDETTWAAGELPLNDAYEAVAKSFPDVGFVDWRWRVSGAFGAPVTLAPIGPGGALAPVRAKDGGHFTEEASADLADTVVDAVLGR